MIITLTGVIAAVCHGCAGLMTPLDTATNEPLVKGKHITGFRYIFKAVN